MHQVGVASSVGSLALALYFWARAQQPSAGLSGPWYTLTAVSFTVSAFGAFAYTGLGAWMRRHQAALADTATAFGCVCGLLPPALTVSFALLFAFG